MSSNPNSDPAANKYVFLVEFAVRHPDFQVAELESVLDMFDVQDLEILPLPAPQVDSHRPFRILSLPLDSKWVPHCFRVGKYNDQKEDIGSLILDRCTLVRSVIELWGAAPTIAACVSQTLEWTTTHIVGQRIFEHCADTSQAWKCTIQTLGTKYSREDQDEMRLHFSKLNFKGPVRMKDPDNEYVLIREIELNLNGAPVITQSTTEKAEATAWYYGRALGSAGRSKGRLNGKLDSYSLKKRSYLGPTSMDAELSSIMTNLGQVRRGQIVLDPFCGTGSILLSCGLRGAFCIGTDIDIRVIRGHSQEKSVVGNFFQYSLPRPEMIRCDNHSYKRHWRLTTSNLYDAIVCDPPYGIRAGARKSGSKRNVIKPVVDRHDHIAQTQPYDVAEVLSDLLNVAALTLRMHGRLVYVIADDDSHKPEHPSFRLVHSCFQPLNEVYGRRFVVLEKIKDYDAEEAKASSRIVLNSNLREKIEAAAKQKPHYAEKLALRKEKRRKQRLEKTATKKAKTEDEDGK